MIRVNTDSRSSTNVTRNYKWNVKITQIDCTSKLEEIRNLKGNIISPDIAFPFIINFLTCHSYRCINIIYFSSRRMFAIFHRSRGIDIQFQLGWFKLEAIHAEPALFNLFQKRSCGLSSKIQ